MLKLKNIELNNSNKFKENFIKRNIKKENRYFIIAKELEDLYVIPKKDEQYRIITSKQYNAFSVILSLLSKDIIINELYLSVYSINETVVKSIINYIEMGRIEKCCFILSQFFNATKRPENWTTILSQYCDKCGENVKYIFTMNHSKVIAAKTNTGDFIVFEGSGNMTKNANIEQYIYENSEEVFNFHKNWMEECQNQQKRK